MNLQTHSVLVSVFILFFICIVRHATAEVCGTQSIDDQLNTIFSLYDRDEIRSKVDIVLGLEIHHVTVLEETSSVHLLADLRMTWNDSRLNWNSSSANCSFTLVEVDRIWQPAIVILNGGASESASGDPQKAKVTTNSTVTWFKSIDVTVPCSMELTKWPNDIQNCKFKFGSRRHTVEEMALNYSDSKYKTELEGSSWELISSSGQILTLERSGESYNVAAWSISMRRHAPAHSVATNIVFASVILEFFTAALLPPLGRVPLCACIALSITLWLVATLPRLPGSASAPLVLPLMSAILIITCITALLAAVVQRVAKLRSTPPASLRRLLTNVAAVVEIMPQQSTDYGDGACVWIAAATLLDRILLLIELLTLIIILCVYEFSIPI